jgi:hypothetical protein
MEYMDCGASSSFILYVCIISVCKHVEWKWKKEDEDGCNYLHVFRDLQRQIEEDEE